MNQLTELRNLNQLKQSNKLNLSRFKLSSISLDILYLFISQIRQSDSAFFEYKVSFTELEKKLGKQINRRFMNDIARELNSAQVFLKLEDGSEGYTNWCSSAFYHKTEHWFRFRMSEELRDFLLNVDKNYALIDFRSVLKLNSVYAKRLFTIFNQFDSTNFFVTTIDDLKFIFELEDKYPTYCDFKKRVLNIAIKQINELTDYNVILKEFKNGKKVERIQFSFFKKEIKDKINKVDNWLTN